MGNSLFIKHAIVLISILVLFSTSSLTPLFNYLGVPTGAVAATAYVFLFIGLLLEIGETFKADLSTALVLSTVITLIAFTLITFA